MKNKFISASLCVISLFLLFSSCSKTEETTITTESSVANTIEETDVTSESSETTVEETTTPTTNYDGLVDPNNTEFALNPITGIQSMDPENVGIRGMSIVVSNVRPAIPQRGISKADAIYEYETEGGITRLLCVFADIKTCPEIGSLRSGRIVSANLAAGTNSIFVHFGREPRAVDYFKKYNLTHLDGNYICAGKYSSSDYQDGYVKLPKGSYFWRDKEWASKRAIEHTAVGSGAHILNAIKNKHLRLEGETPLMFKFVPDNSKDIANSTTTCNKAVVRFSGYNKDTTFDYNPETNLYYKSQYGKPQIDATTNEQISFTNVFVLYCPISIAKDNYRTNVYLQYGGNGYYISNGKIVEVTWYKKGPKELLKVFNKDGEEIEVNRGKSYICIPDDDQENKFKFS